MTYADIRLANDLDVPLYCLFERRSQNSRERDINASNVLRSLDEASCEVLRRHGDSYRGMPFTELAKVLADADFVPGATYSAGSAVLHVFCQESRGVFVTADVADGKLDSMTIQFRSRERGVDHKTGSSIELAPSYFHHAVDGTGGFRLKIRTLIDAGAAMPEWHNLDSHGERFPAVWLSLARDRGGETTYWTHNVVSEGDYGDEPPFLLPKLMISTLKSTMGHAPEPSEEIKRWGRRMDAIKSLQASRLHALPTRWREIADLDFRRRVTQVAP